jgi:hypothetical protein
MHAATAPGTDAPAALHPTTRLRTRYGAVLKASWGLRHELAGPKRLADERAFPPAALALQDSRPRAMAAFSPPPAGQTTLSANYQTALAPVIAADWQ